MFGQEAIRSLGVVSFKATKIIERPISDKARSAATLFVLLARRTERSHCPSNAPWLRTGLVRNRAATLAKIHGAERAHFPTERRGRV